MRPVGLAASDPRRSRRLAVGPRQRTRFSRGVSLGASASPSASSKAPSGMRRRTVHTSSNRAKMDEIIKLVQEGKRDPVVIEHTRAILTRKQGGQWAVQPKNDPAEVAAVFDWVQRNIRYTGDISDVETLQRARRTLDLQSGDCDDHTILVAAMLESVGFPTRLRIIDTGDGWSHIYTVVGMPRQDPSRWVPLDTTEPHNVGWEVPSRFVRQKQDWDVQTGRRIRVAGFGQGSRTLIDAGIALLSLVRVLIR